MKQVIPRPAGSRAGGRPAWLGGPVLSLAEVRLRVQQDSGLPLPTAAVLCLLFEQEGQLHTVLTRRSANLRTHTGEVSFPGGRLEPGESPVEAALRETREEVGIRPEQIEVIGCLSPFATMSSQRAILCYVGVLAEPPVLEPNPEEVELAFTLPLSKLMEVYHQEIWDFPGASDYPIHFFTLEEDIVWGVTARMLEELLALPPRG